MVNYYKNGLVMINLRMNDEDKELLLNVLIDYTNEHRPISYGGSFKDNPRLTEEQWLRLIQLIQLLPVEINL